MHKLLQKLLAEVLQGTHRRDIKEKPLLPGSSGAAVECCRRGRTIMCEWIDGRNTEHDNQAIALDNDALFLSPGMRKMLS